MLIKVTFSGSLEWLLYTGLTVLFIRGCCMLSFTCKEQHILRAAHFSDKRQSVACGPKDELCEEFERVIRICKPKKTRQHNGLKKKDKQRSTNRTHKTKDRVTRTHLKPWVNSGAPEG